MTTVTDWITWIDYILYKFLARWGRAIVENPNRFFYAIIIIASFLFPRLSLLILLCLLCWAYENWYGV